MKWYYVVLIIILGSILYVHCIEEQERVQELKKNSVSEDAECVEGVLYTTYGFKDLVIYEPQYIPCE